MRDGRAKIHLTRIVWMRPLRAARSHAGGGVKVVIPERLNREPRGFERHWAPVQNRPGVTNMYAPPPPVILRPRLYAYRGRLREESTVDFKGFGDYDVNC